MTQDHKIKHRFHGRRKGKTLTAYRQKLLEEEFPRYEITDLLSFRPIHSASGGILKNAKDSAVSLCSARDNAFDETWLEIGFGNGEFLSHMCQNHPDIHFIGCEPFVNGVAALLVSLDTDAPVNNLSLWNDDARLLMDAMPPECLDRVYLLNPDPWPKTRHEKRRFIQNETLDGIARLLKPGGQFIMSTDVPDLANWMHVHTWNHAAFEWGAKSQDDWLSPPTDWPLDKTRYMKKALGGEIIYWLKFNKV